MKIFYKIRKPIAIFLITLMLVSAPIFEMKKAEAVAPLLLAGLGSSVEAIAIYEFLAGAVVVAGAGMAWANSDTIANGADDVWKGFDQESKNFLESLGKNGQIGSGKQFKPPDLPPEQKTIWDKIVNVIKTRVPEWKLLTQMLGVNILALGATGLIEKGIGYFTNPTMTSNTLYSSGTYYLTLKPNEVLYIDTDAFDNNTSPYSHYVRFNVNVKDLNGNLVNLPSYWTSYDGKYNNSLISDRSYHHIVFGGYDNYYTIGNVKFYHVNTTVNTPWAVTGTLKIVNNKTVDVKIDTTFTKSTDLTYQNSFGATFRNRPEKPWNPSTQYDYSITDKLTTDTILTPIPLKEYESNPDAQDQVLINNPVPDTTAPAPVTEVSVSEITYKSAMVSYTPPSDGDYSHTNLYLNGSLYASPFTSGSLVSGLEQYTLYNITLNSVDTTGNESSGVSSSFRTLTGPVAELDSSTATQYQDKLINKTGFPLFKQSLDKLSAIGNGCSSVPPKFEIDLNALANTSKHISGNDIRPFEQDKYTLVDFAVLDNYDFEGMKLIDVARLLISFGLIYMTVLYCWRKIVPDKALSGGG